MTHLTLYEQVSFKPTVIYSVTIRISNIQIITDPNTKKKKKNSPTSDTDLEPFHILQSEGTPIES